ncbi:MAG TPA: serine dehydratase subunit alpha family protein, partial [Firmicutes bacterium]|nr:serine dehydratase subunit alpha family protein [Bacillota bacterium]
MLTLKAFLRHEVKPALGCTEPAAVALAVATACRQLDRPHQPEWVKVSVSDSIFKNGMAVGIPGANGAKGNAMAAALAVLKGNPDYGLEVLKDCRPEDVAVAARWVDEGRVQVECLPAVHGVYVEAVVQADGHQAACVIEEHHSNVARLTKDGQPVALRPSRDGAGEVLPVLDVLEMVKHLSYRDLLQLAEQMDDEDVEYIWRGIEMNRAIAEYGLREDVDCGLCVGRTLASLMARGAVKDDLGYELKSYCCAASDARMAGAQLPVMSSAGSGNHGIAAILPIALLGERLGKSRREIAKAVAVSHLVTSMVKSKTGRLSPICGCAAAAGAGATAGLTYLQGGTPE